MEKGTRKLSGRYYILAGRGTYERCQLEADALRIDHYVRVVPAYNKTGKLARLLDDYMIYIFPRNKDDASLQHATRQGEKE